MEKYTVKFRECNCWNMDGSYHIVATTEFEAENLEEAVEHLAKEIVDKSMNYDYLLTDKHNLEFYFSKEYFGG